MKAIFKSFTMALGMLLLASITAPAANAQCGSLARVKARLKPMAFNPANLPDWGHNDGNSDEPIVGFWKVTFAAKNMPIPDGTIIDFGYAQWHSDKTEIMNSGMRPPATGSFCMGVWGKTGRFSYRLNHFAISYNADNTLAGVVNIREDVTVAPNGRTYQGTFTINAYDTNNNPIPPEKGGHAEGIITGARVTVDTTVN